MLLFLKLEIFKSCLLLFDHASSCVPILSNKYRYLVFSIHFDSTLLCHFQHLSMGAQSAIFKIYKCSAKINIFTFKNVALFDYYAAKYLFYVKSENYALKLY